MKNAARILSLVLLGVNSVGAFYGGSLLMLDPSGGLIQMPLHWLAHSPFANYFIPGLVLFFVNGVFSLVVAILAIKKIKTYGYYVCLEVILLVGWILLQVDFIQMIHPLHIIMGSIGFALFVLGVIQTEDETFKRNSVQSE